MFFSRYSRIFRSRWSALFWAAGVLWGAVEFIGIDTSHAKPGVESNSSTQTDATGSPVTDQDLAILRNVIGE